MATCKSRIATETRGHFLLCLVIFFDKTATTLKSMKFIAYSIQAMLLSVSAGRWDQLIDNLQFLVEDFLYVEIENHLAK